MKNYLVFLIKAYLVVSRKSSVRLSLFACVWVFFADAYMQRDGNKSLWESATMAFICISCQLLISFCCSGGSSVLTLSSPWFLLNLWWSAKYYVLSRIYNHGGTSLVLFSFISSFFFGHRRPLTFVPAVIVNLLPLLE